MLKGNVYLGLFLLVTATLLLIGSNQVLYYLVDNPLQMREITLANNLDNGTTIENISFTFDRNLIFSNYDISNGQRLYTSYINVYIEEFLDNTSTESIPIFTLNNAKYQPVNRTYQYSVQIEDESLQPLYQSFKIEKSPLTTINKVTLNYRGIGNTNYEFYQYALFTVVVILFFSGIGVLWKR